MENSALVLIYLLLLLTLLGFAISVIKVLSILLIVHLFTWASAGSYLSANMFQGEKADRKLQQILLGFFIGLGIAMIVITIFFL